MDVSRRLEYLDSARGLAALSVVYSHFMGAYMPPEWVGTPFYNSPLHAAWDGFAAVSLFFVLSGLVLSFRLFDSRGKPLLGNFSFAGYAVTRFIRIFFPYIVVLLLSCLVWRVFGDYSTTPAPQNWIKFMWREDMGWPLIYFNLNLLAAGLEYQILPQAWTLSSELILSLGIPFAVLVAGYSTRWFVFAVLFLLVLMRTNQFCLHFALGVGLAKANAMGFRIVGRRLKVAALVGGFLLYTSRFSVEPYLPFAISGPTVWGLTGFGSLLLLWTILSSQRVQNVLNHRWLVFLGRVSFQVYLCHFIVLLRVVPLFLVLLNRHVTTNWWLGFIAAFVVTTVVTIGFSWGLYVLVEKPCLRLAKRVAGLVSGRSRRQVAVLVTDDERLAL